jgi:micrococcal nuclease
MKNALIPLIVSICSMSLPAEESAAAKNSPVTYGQAVVSSILRLDENITFYCNIEGFPPLIGENMPVRIKSLKAAGTPQENQRLLVFLNGLLFSKDKPVKTIVLKEIERGRPFCLVADIEVDGRDLCDLLVEKNLARKIVEVNGSRPEDTSVEPEDAAGKAAVSAAGEPLTYIASKSSKVYHRSTCPHAKRLDMTKAITFSSSEEAAKTGRRPCKTCNP